LRPGTWASGPRAWGAGPATRHHAVVRYSSVRRLKAFAPRPVTLGWQGIQDIAAWTLAASLEVAPSAHQPVAFSNLPSPLRGESDFWSDQIGSGFGPMAQSDRIRNRTDSLQRSPEPAPDPAVAGERSLSFGSESAPPTKKPLPGTVTCTPPSALTTLRPAGRSHIFLLHRHFPCARVSASCVPHVRGSSSERCTSKTEVCAAFLSKRWWRSLAW
jgi:hypothetical protein